MILALVLDAAPARNLVITRPVGEVMLMSTRSRLISEALTSVYQGGTPDKN